ncbi:PREDICTED: ephrin type-A receptor 3-like isoform X2 [Acropora digitifera]|uniref:ephrin type-A receptor 3-like isoform X2 n=1 Tax=Acropora digitifera TaxID=70779 RepID=UPI00077AA5BF|nr:PREDICTED: ephrin type-A receptor 3-like isoform X2 [Acropora digitifera]
MEHFWITGLVALVFSSLVSSEQHYILETPDCSSCIWSWDTAAYFQFPELGLTWHQPTGKNNLYSICNPNNPQEPNNWLRSLEVIEVGDIQRLDVTFRYSSRQCFQSASFCKEFFYAYVWESNTSVTTREIPHPINDFQLYRRFANITRQSDQETILTVPLHVTSKYIVLGIRDQGGCRTLYSVKVSYTFCSKKTLKDRLVSFPSTIAHRQVESIPVQGFCVAKSRQILPGNLTIFCDSDGEWNTSRLESRCVCEKDMESRDGFCTACPAGTFNEGRGFNCTEIPSIARNTKVTFVNQSAVKLTWQLPEVTGYHTDVYYDVECRNTCNDNDEVNCDETACRGQVSYLPSKQGLHETHVLITHLSSFVTYEFRIYARNRVSGVAQKMHGIVGNFALYRVTTNASIPSKVQISFEQLSDTMVRISWTLDSANGILLAYYLTYIRVDDTKDSKTIKTTKTEVILTELKVGKTYSFVVAAENHIGRSYSDSVIKTIIGNDASPVNTTLMVICVTLSTILLIGATSACVYVYQQRKATKRSSREGGSVSRVGEDRLDNSLAIATPQTNRGDAFINHGQYIEMTDTPDLELERNEIKFIRLLGSGNFGEVYKAIINDCTVAVKSLKENASQKDKQDMLTELQMMKCLRSHNHIVQMIGYSTHRGPLLLILEYMPYGDLLGYLRISRGHNDTYNSGEKKPTSRLTDMELLSFAWMIADGMSYLADRKVVHRDLAARNILVGENKICKISDFGLARDVNSEVYVRTSQARLPVKWMPPESLFLGESSTKSDVWSYGIVLWEVFTIGDSPYPGVKPREVASLLERGYRMPRPNHISEELYAVMSECWLEKPEDRPTFRRICAAMKRLINDRRTYVNLDVYNDKDYVNFDMVDDLQ